MVMVVAWVVWAITSQTKIFDFCFGEGFDWSLAMSDTAEMSPRSLAKNVVFAA